MKLNTILASLISIAITNAVAAPIVYKVDLMNADGSIKPIGTITVDDTKYGLLLTPNLTDLPPGLHGFHVHEHASCAHEGKEAGSHLDPKKTGKHLGPYNNGHLGDLPALYVDNNGTATLPVLAPRLKQSVVKNHSLMIHAGGDNYSDNPTLGGGGARIACGT